MPCQPSHTARTLEDAPCLGTARGPRYGALCASLPQIHTRAMSTQCHTALLTQYRVYPALGPPCSTRSISGPGPTRRSLPVYTNYCHRRSCSTLQLLRTTPHVSTTRQYQASDVSTTGQPLLTSVRSGRGGSDRHSPHHTPHGAVSGPAAAPAPPSRGLSHTSARSMTDSRHVTSRHAVTSRHVTRSSRRRRPGAVAGRITTRRYRCRRRCPAHLWERAGCQWDCPVHS